MDEDLELLIEECLEEVEGGLEAGFLKWLPGPSSWLGSGAVRGSRMYFCAWAIVSKSCFVMTKSPSRSKLGSLHLVVIVGYHDLPIAYLHPFWRR